MTTCKHCGTELSENMEVCPNCGQRNTDYADESYLDSLLNSVTSGKPEDRFSAYTKAEKPKKAELEELPMDFFADADDDDLLGYNIFDETVDKEELDQMIAQELSAESENEAAFEAVQEEPPEPVEELYSQSAEQPVEQPVEQQPEPVVFDDPALAELFTLDPAIEELLTVPEEEPVQEETAQEEYAPEQPPEEVQEETASAEELPELDSSIFEGFTFDEPEEASPFAEILDEKDIVALDDLFQEIDAADAAKEQSEGVSELQQMLAEDFGEDELLSAAGAETVTKEKGKKKKKDKRSLAVRLFGNVPVDPSKIKHEPTPEEIAEAKQAKAEKKKQSKAEKKAAADEKKTAGKQAKEEKAKQKQLAKEEKKAKKLEQAKLILEDMEDTRINRVGATIIFVAFGLIAFILIAGSNMLTYEVAIRNAEKSFNMALNNSVSYYNDAYNEIYGLELKDEDVDLGDKIMTVMYVNKQLNSYNSFVAIGDEASALDSLLKGLNRYEKYSIIASLMGYDDILDDLDYVSSQILLELDKRYSVTLDEASRLSKLISDGMALDYSREVYKIVDERPQEPNAGIE